jgi:tRNA(Ile)-lysidine synthase
LSQFPLKAVKRAISLNRVMIKTAKNVATDRSRTRTYPVRTYRQKAGTGMNRMRISLGHVGHVVKSFLRRHWDGRSPLLAAYSGGPDSKAILYAAIQARLAPIHIAHVDHGWRLESRDEALLLQKEAAALGVPFHSIRLEKMTTEDEARLSRLQYFRSLSEKIPFQAVLLGHHADDLAETVLKRVLEGAHLSRLSGMKAISQIDNVLIWRPLLSIARREIQKWLSHRSLTAFYDRSNDDPHYLRARMRLEMMPLLSRSFGKNISENLAVLSDRSLELEQYLASRIIRRPIKGPFGWWIDGHGLHRLEIRHLLLQVSDVEHVTMTRPVLETILAWMEGKKTNHRIDISHRVMIVDRGHFFLLAQNMPQFGQPLVLSGGVRRSGDWAIEECAPCALAGGWQALWRGKALIQNFDGEATLQIASSDFRWREKVPLFLKKICPVVVGAKGSPAAKRFVKIFIDREQPSVEGDMCCNSMDCLES